MSTHVYCAFNSQHTGPYALYAWNVTRTFAGRKTAVTLSTTSQQGILCENCARSIGAWPLPEKKESKEQNNVSK